MKQTLNEIIKYTKITTIAIGLSVLTSCNGNYLLKNKEEKPLINYNDAIMFLGATAALAGAGIWKRYDNKKNTYKNK